MARELQVEFPRSRTGMVLMQLEIIGEIRQIETIALGGGIQESRAFEERMVRGAGASSKG